MRDYGHMEAHEQKRTRRFLVPPHNLTVIEIDSTRAGRHYVGILDYDRERGEYRHRYGCASGHETFLRALEAARSLWAREVAASPTPPTEREGE